MSLLRANPLSSLARTTLSHRRPLPLPSTSFRRPVPAFSLLNSKAYSTSKESADKTKEGEVGAQEAAGEDAKVTELNAQLEAKNKMIAELKDGRLRALADFENLQKISSREKVQAKDFALTSFARDLISSIDILSLALASIPPSKLTAGHAEAEKGFTPNADLVSLHEGVKLTKGEIERVLKRHGVTPFDPTGEQFDPNKHEALYQAPVPGKTPGSVLETQEIGYMIKDRVLRPAKVGVVSGEA